MKLSRDSRLAQFSEFLELNCTGLNSAKTSKELAQWGCPRTLRRMVRDLRSRGSAICSGDYGYYMAESRSDLQRTANRLNSMAKADSTIAAVLLQCNTHLGLAPSFS